MTLAADGFGVQKTRMRGNAQHVVALACTTDAKLLWQYEKCFVTMATGVG